MQNFTNEYNNAMAEMEREMSEDKKQVKKDKKRAEKYHDAVDVNFKKRLQDDPEFAKAWYKIHPEDKK